MSVRRDTRRARHPLFGALQTLPSLGSLTQFLEQQSLSKVHLLPSGTQVQLASLGLQTLPSLGSLTQFLEQQSLSKVHLLPSGTHVQSLAG